MDYDHVRERYKGKWMPFSPSFRTTREGEGLRGTKGALETIEERYRRETEANHTPQQ